MASNLQNPLSQNAYQYAYDNPINLDDPSGEFVKEAFMRWGMPLIQRASNYLGLIRASNLGFASKERLLDHFSRHAKGLGFKNLNDYLKGARNLFKGGNGIQTYTRVGGDKLFYNPTTNEFGILSKDNVIRTYYSPDKGLKYFLNEIAKDKANRLK